MSYTRYTNRKNERASTKDAARMTRTEANRLTDKVLSALMAAGLVMSPTAVDASEIKDVNNQPVSAESGVYNIYAQKRHGDIAINEFAKFQLDANHIANLYFHKQGETINAGNLLNFVNTRIDINGTVNAIRNGTIGGNLFFLSPEGMAVGKSGVINTGALYVMAPATTSLPGESNYGSLKGVFDKGAATEDHLNAIKNGSPLIPLNPSGTISVLGKINAADDVKLYAAQIAVGRNLTGQAIDGTAAGGVEKAAAIETGVTDFASLVNLTDDQKTAAGLGNLQATQTGNGDIVLAAKAAYANAYDKAFNDLGKLAGLLGTTEPPEINVPKTITASVENYGTIKTSTATGDVVLKAEATNGNKDSASGASAFAQTVADVKVQGDVKAAGQVELTAKADNTYVDSGNSVTDNLGDTLSYVVPVGANVMILDNKASVTVEKEAQVEGSQVAASAEANLDGTAGVTAAGRKLVSKVPSAIPAVGMGYAKATNEATVQIDGKVKATGADTVDDKGNVKDKALQIKADAQSAVDHSASTTVKSGVLGAGSSSLAAAVAITDHKNDAKVAINGTAEAEQGSTSVTADTVHQLNTSATAKAADETVGTAAVDVVVHASTSAVDVQGTVNAKNDVTIQATNTTDENTHVSNNNLGMGKLQAEAMKAADLTGISNKVKENKVVSGILSKLQKDGGNTDVPLSTTLGQTLSAGAAVTVADETNTAKVNIGSKASVQAGQELTAKAESKVYDTMMAASGATSSFKNSDNSSDTVTIATGVVYAGMDNQADVTVADGTAAQHATLKADGNLNLQSSNTMEYHRPERMKRELDRSIEKLDTAIAAIENMPEAKQEQAKEILEQLEKLKTSMTRMAAAFTADYLQDTSNVKNLTAEGTLNKISNVAGTGWEILNAVTKIQQSVGQLQDVTSPFGEVVTNALAVVTNAVAFTEPNQYANVSAAAVSRGGSDTKASLAAAVTATDFDYGSHVTVGKHASLTAGNALNLKAEEAVKDVNITGKNKVWKNDAEAAGGVGIGGSVNYQNFDTDTLVKVDKGAALTAGDMELASSSDIFHTGVMLSAGKAEGSAISGMLAMTDSDSKNQTLVDKDAVLKAVKDADKKGSIAITGYNDTNVNNAILSLSAGSGAAAAGIAAAINKVDVVNRAAVENIDAADDDEKSGSIQASKLGVSAETTGLINTISVAGGVTTSGKDPEKPEADKGPLDKLGDGFGKLAGLTDTVNGKINDVSKKVQNVISTVNGAGASQGGTQSAVPTKSETAPSFAFAGAGSVSLNLVSDTTKAVIDGAHVNLNNDGVLQAGARDTAFVGAFSGGAAISARKGQSSGTSAAFSGAVGVNKIENTIESAVKNSTVEGLKSMDVTALSGGTSVAVGTGLSLTKNSQPGNNFAGGASVSVNLIDKDVKALAEKNTVSGVSANEKAAVKLTAYESDLQVTGGVNANVATGGGTAVGGSITVADIKNDLDARISGGMYTNIEKADAESLLATKQITAAISTGVAVGGSGTNNAFTGAMVYNGLHNTVQAGIDGRAKVTADSIAVRAHDTTSGSAEAKPYQDLLGNYKEHQQFAEDAGVDTDGSSYYKTSDSSNGLDTAGETVDYDANKGSLSVGAAFVVAGSSGNAAGAAVNVANVDNDFTAAIADATLVGDSVSAEADADSLAVNVSAGVAAGSKDFGGMGSVTWQDMDNTVLAKASDSAITADSLAVKAASNSQAVNVAGSVAYGKTAGVGAALAYNGLDNHIGAYLAGGSVTAKTPSTGVSVDVEGKNTGKIYGIGAAVAASQNAAVNGTVVVNHGGSDTEAVVGEVRPEDGTNTVKDTAVANAKAVKVKAESDDVRVAAAGNVSASGKVALGGAVAYNDVGGASTSTAKASQKTRAALNKTTLTHVKNGSTSVEAVDGSTLTTAAVGVGGAGKVAVQGAAATALVNKAVTAEMKDSTVDQAADKGADVTVKSDSKSTINSLAAVGAGGSDFAGGAGVAVNRINQDTAATMSGSTVKDKHTTVQADGNSTITSIGVGAALAGKVALAGNIAVNQIGNNVKAAVTGSTLTSSGNIGVLASGKENLTNFAGTVSGAAGNAGLGMGVSYNAITGNVESTVEESSLEARGKETETVGDAQKGVAVTASGQHNLKSVALTAGLAGSDTVAVGAAGTVTVNNIGGATRAAVTGTDINAELDNSMAGDVAVKAHDVTKSESHVGSLSVGIGADGGAGVSAASDTLLLDRETAAELSGTDAAKKTVKGRNLAVTADQKSTVVTNVDGVAGAGGIYGSGAVAATAAATKLDGSVTATMKNIISNNKGLDISAKHDHETTLVSASAAMSAAMVSGAVGAGVGVVNDDFATKAELVGSEVTAKKDSSRSDSGSVNVAADSSTGVTTVVAGVAGSMGAAASTISVNNLNSQTSAVVDDSTVTADQDFTVDAHNKVNTTFNAAIHGAGGAAIATGVGVNTIGTSTLAKVDMSTVTAQKAAITSREEMDVDQNLVGATAGGLGINANVMVTSIGTELADTYGSSDNNGASFDTTAALKRSNTALDSQKTATTDDGDESSKVVKDTLHNADTGVAATDASGVTASSGKSDAKGTQVAVTNSDITTTDTMALRADRKTDAKITAASASVSGSLGLSATVAVLDAKKDAGVSIRGSKLQAGKALSVAAAQSGETGIDAYQANIAGVAAVSAAYAQSSSSGETKIEAVDSTLTSDKEGITMKAEDKSQTASSVYGATAGLVTAGALVSKADNTSDVNLAIKGSALHTAQGTASLQADKANVVTAKTYGGAFGLVGANGVVALASDEGASKILVAQSDSKKNSVFRGQTASLQATTRPAVTAETGSLSVALLGSASASVATASAKGEAGVQIADGTTLDVDKAEITASAESQNGENNSEAKVKGFAAAGRGTAVVNTATANTDIDTEVTLGKASFKKNQGTALSVTSANTTQTAADARGITVGGLFASGTNLAYTGSGTEKDANTATITLQGNKTQLKSLSANASGTTHNLTTADGSGGGMISGDLAGAVDNKTYTGSKVTLNGSWDVNGDVAIQSAQTDHMDLNADATKAAVVGTSATKADNTASGAADVVLTDSRITSGGMFTAKADSKANLGQNKTYAVEGSGYGGVAVQGTKLNNTVNRTANVDAGNASLTSSGSQILAAESGGKINAAGYIKAAGAGAATWVDVDNHLTSKNTIRTDKTTSLRTDTADSDITLAASDDWNVTAKGVADTQGGAVGGASSNVKNTLQRTNKVDVQGSVYSLNDVNLYAGKDANGAMDNLDLQVDSEAYNKTALSVAVPKFKDTLTQSNQVVVGKDADVSSVRHVHAYADEAGKYLREQSVKYTWYHSDANENFTSTSVGKKSDNINDTTDNYVQIDGKVTAGAQNKQKVVIGGSGQIVVLDQDELAAVKAVKGQENAVQHPTIDASSGIDTANITYARIDYANALMTRYYELAKLISQYSDSKDLTALKGYQDEQTRIYNELNDLGLLSKAIGEDGREYLVPVSGLTVDTITLPDIVASGGNITVEAGSLKGAGTLKAQGSPEATVENHTNLYLKVGDVRAVNPGGEIHYNGQSLAKDAVAIIKSANQDEAAAVNLTVSTDAATSTGGTVTIKSDYGTAAIKAKIDEVDAYENKTGRKVDAELVPKADIEINGNVEAENGVVTVEDKNYNILLQGAGSRTAEVNGKEIHLTAGKSISQGFTQGIVNIGGNPEELYKKQFNSDVNAFNETYGYEHTSRVHQEVHQEDRTQDTVLNGSGSRIAGDNIYINASDINVNGLIQSGYGKYEVTVSDAVMPKVQKLDRSWARMGKQNLSDAVITTGTYYLVQEGGKVLQADGTYKYQPDVYYNPSTQKLVIPDIDAHGGKIYLSGRISSTGNGKIVALDGAYDISVTNNTNTALQVGKLISNKNVGLISIADSSNNRLTEYTRSRTVVKDLTNWDKAAGDWKVLSTSGASSVYNPQKDLRYNWTSGQKVTTKKHYEHDHKAGLWGAVTTLNETELTKYEQEITPQDMGHKTFTNDNGVYIDTSSLTNKDKQYVFVYDNVVLNNSRTQPVVTKRWKTGFLGWFHWERTEWDTNTGTAQQYVGSVKADHGIDIGFLGNQNGNSAINVTSKADVALTGKIQSSQSGAGSTIAITSQEGAINQNGGLLKGDNVRLSAKKGLTNIAIESLGDTLKLDAANTGRGNMNITVDGAYGKAGHVNLVQAKNTNGDVSLTVLGNLTQSTAEAVKGNRIDIVSRQGGVGTAATALKVETPDHAVDVLNPLSSSVNVTAKGNIHLAEDSDMRVGTIKSTGGNVTLTTAGSLIDALPSGETIDRGNTATLVQGWKDLGLIDGDGQYKQKQAEDVAAYKDGVQSEFAQYLNLKTAYANKEEAAENDVNYQTLKDRYGDYTSADDYLAKSDTAKNHLANLQKAGAGWTENELLYAISDAIVNKAQGCTDTELKEANISGQNITLHAKNIGSDKAAEDVLVKDITTDARLDDLKKVVNANVSDVGYTKNDKGENVFRIYGKVPVGIEARGELNVQSDGNIYVAGRTSGENKDTVLKLGKVTTSTGDIRVLGKAGVTNSLKDGSANLKGKDLILEGGSSDIGATDKPIDVDLTGSLSALTDGSMYISSVGNHNLQLSGLYAGKDMVLASRKDIAMSPDASAQAYLNAGRLLDLKAEGGIGAKDSGVRILGNGATINAEAKDGNIYLAGKRKAGEQDGLLLLGTVKTNPGHTIDVAAETSLGLGRNESASTLVSQVQADTVNLSSDREIDLKNGTLTAVTLNLKAGGSINQTAAHAITASDVSVDAAAGISLNSGAEAESKMFNAFKEVTLNNANEATDIVLGNGGDEDLKVIFADGSKAKDVTVRNYANGEANDLDIHGPIAAAAGIALINDEGSLVTTGGLDAKADIRETAKGSLNNSDALHAEQDIVLTATDGSIINDAAITAKRNVTMKAGDSIENRAATTAYTGAISLNAYHDIKQKGDAKAGTDITAESADGSVTVEGSLTSGKATLAKATDGDVSIHGDVQSGTSAAVQADNGSVTVTGDITSGTSADLSAAGGDVSVTGNVTGDTSVTAQATEGNVTVGGSLISQNGDTVLSASDSQKLEDKGNIRVTGSVDSAHDIEMTTDNGAIEVGGTTQAAQDIRAAAEKTGQIRFVGDAKAVVGRLQAKTDVGDISFEGKAASGTDLTAETTDGSISFEEQTTSGRDLSAATKRRGDITFAGLINAGRDAIADAAQSGTITLRRDVTANRDIKMHTHDGSMVFDGRDAGKAEDIRLTAVSGNVELRTTGTGDIKDSHRQENGDRAFVNATNGNVTIRHEGTGNVDLYGLYAKKEAATELKNGSLYLDTMDGDLVAMFVRNPDKVMNVKHITAGQEIAVAGADIGIDDILQREGAEGLLTITPKGASDDALIKNLHIGDIRTNEGSGVRFKHLWLENGDVSVSKGQLLLDKLYVLDKARFSNGVMTTNVFGTAPIYEEGVTSAYWNDTAINDPKEALSSWLNGEPDEKRWMFLHFYGQVNAQHSNGNLLDLADHYRVNRERYTEADWMRMMKDKDRYDFYRTYYHPALSLHDRFGLVDASDYLGASKAKPGVTDVDEAESEKA
ncbi:leukotoxin LktA family filamentous adhesin [Mitsuokella sp. UBA4253]|uniref:leukotoxin LktA family filamentous adhesin n=1 Tax=Mitsuokella sp. UBA4253 TaxID=1946959 RepID=UPI00257E42B7|nr:leukotoxin LktA family filamentous adhesin [Mitsuokella sp. UBA4253]